MKRDIAKFYLPAFAAFCAFILTLLAFFLTTKSINEREALAFNSLSVQVKQSISTRMQTYINALVQTRSMFYVTDEVDRKEFYHYIENLNLLEEYPGIQGIGFTKRILKKDLASHITAIRKAGFPQYKVWPEFNRPEYHTIIYLEPFNWRNQKAFGFDMFTDATRREAMEKARDTGRPIITNRVTLVQETGHDIQQGFLIYVPFYEDVATEGKVEERRDKLRGFIYSPFRAKDLFKDILTPYKKAEIGIKVYIDSSDKKDLIYSSHQESLLKRALFSHQYEIGVASKKWVIKTYSLPGFGKPVDLAPLLLLILGLTFSFLLFWFIWKHQKYSIDERDRAKNYEVLNQIGRTLSAELDLDKLVHSITDAGLKLSKASFGAFFYKGQDERDKKFTSSTFSGTSRGAFREFPIPRDTPIFEATFIGQGTIRIDDITKDSRFPEGHFPVKSYLAVSVISRTGEVIGGLFYSHPDRAVFGPREQILIEGIASQAAIAIDNAKLHKKTMEAVAARDEFLSIASHELKTPITSMKLQFQLAQKLVDINDERAFDQAQIRKRIQLANAQLDRMSKLVSDMLETARFSSQRLDLNKEELDLAEVALSVIESLRPQLEVQEIKLEFKNQATSPLIIGDRFRLEQVMTNLITNAMKYGLNKPIDVRLEERDGAILFKVQDRGMGIPKDQLPKIFNRFERAISSTNISGLGLGLYISREIIKAHGGEIRVESTPHQGSTFTVELPRFK